MFQAVCEIFECNSEFLVTAGGWKCQIMWKEFDGIEYSLGFGDGVVTIIVSVMMWCWADVVSWVAAIDPCEPVSRPIMYDDLAARRR